MTEAKDASAGVLVLAPLGRDGEVACHMLSQARIACTNGHDLGDLLGAPIERLGAVILTEDLLTREAVQSVIDRLESQEPWSNLPVVLLVNSHRRRAGDEQRAAALEAFISQPGVFVLQRPMHVASFVSVVRAALLARRKQYELRDELEARARAEERAATLAEEMKHRVKNAFAVAAGIASQTFRNAETLDAAREAFSGRISSMAQAQDLLTANGHNAHFGSLVDQALKPYRQSEGPDPFDIDGPQVNVSARATTAFAMALHELATNAVKYGALSVPSGRVALEWRTEGAASDEVLIVEWRERGGPPVLPPQRRGFGSRLVEQALANDLAGSAEMEFQPEGLVCTIRAAIGKIDCD